jgi:hypothetical protein
LQRKLQKPELRAAASVEPDNDVDEAESHLAESDQDSTDRARTLLAEWKKRNFQHPRSQTPMSPRLAEPIIDAEGSASAVRPKARETPARVVMTRSRSRTATQQDAAKIPVNRKRKIDRSVLPTIAEPQGNVEETRPKRTRRK